MNTKTNLKELVVDTTKRTTGHSNGHIAAVAVTLPAVVQAQFTLHDQ